MDIDKINDPMLYPLYGLFVFFLILSIISFFDLFVQPKKLSPKEHTKDDTN